MAALIAHVRTGQLAASATVVFLHTGGMPALFTETFVRAFLLQPSTRYSGLKKSLKVLWGWPRQCGRKPMITA